MAVHKVHPACAANSDTIRFGTIYRDIDEWPQAVSDFAALVPGEVRLRQQELLAKSLKEYEKPEILENICYL